MTSRPKKMFGNVFRDQSECREIGTTNARQQALRTVLRGVTTEQTELAAKARELRPSLHKHYPGLTLPSVGVSVPACPSNPVIPSSWTRTNPNPTGFFERNSNSV
ncbi:hypothetical protein SK128_016297 [Halocaridina rubra]|uniref:Uncharacterized protein n=1 Tax=Halocaridina rubra TaxID=373956 RepID=A0AAN9A7F5_HALRR